METNINVTKRTDIYSVDPRNVVVFDNFNVRRDFAIDELKEQIKLQGVLNPITVVPFKDENGDEKYRLVDGERRLRATLAAISEGADIKRIKAIFLPKNTKEEDLLIEQMMRNEGKNFTEYEQAIMFQRFRDKFGYTQSEIAAKFGKTPTFIGRCLSLLDLAPEIQEKIEKGEISTGAVRQIVDLNKDDEKAQVAAVESAISNAQSKGKKTATVKNIDGEAKSQKDFQKVLNGFNILIQATIHAKLEIQEMSARELVAALHGTSNMEELIGKLLESQYSKDDAMALAESEIEEAEILEEPEPEPTPMMKQWSDLKEKHPDKVLLFRCGDFYESYKEDAEAIAEILGITLTKSNGIEMAGFPYHTLDTYLPKLIRAGKRVAICDQLESPIKK